MKKIAIIIPYFGIWPEWFDFYLFTCSRQSIVDFYFFTDCGVPKKIYNNTIFIEMDYVAYCNRISNVLNINFSPKHDAYKLCGCRPFYGVIHKKELENYDYWGFGDIDLIYGDLSIIFNENNLAKYDFITSHSDRVAGHLTIMRNITKYNEACYKIPHWREKLESKTFYGLDEGEDYANIINPFHRYIYIAYNYIFKYFFRCNKYRYFDIAQKITQGFHKRVLFKEQKTTPIPKEEDIWSYDLTTGCLKQSSGRLGSSGSPMIYLHFLFFKRTIYRDTDIYWRKGYYKLPDTFDFENAKGIINISTAGITYTKSLVSNKI